MVKSLGVAVLSAFLGIQSVAAVLPPTDCVLAPWTLEQACQASTLQETWVRTVTSEPSVGACSPLRETRLCKPTNCQMSAWSNWTDACNPDGFKIRTRTQLQAPLAGGRECPHSVDQVRCCEDDCRVGPWSDWVCDTTTNLLTRYRNVTKPAKLPEGKPCPTNLIETGAPCGAPPDVNCEAYTVETDPFPWGKCVVATGTFLGTKTKILAIKVQATGKGKPCLTNAQRTVSRLCPLQEYVDAFNEPINNYNYSGEFLASNQNGFSLKFGKPWQLYQNGVLLGEMQPYNSSDPTTAVFSGGSCNGGTYTTTFSLVCKNLVPKNDKQNPFDMAAPPAKPCEIKGKWRLKTIEICSESEEDELLAAKM